MKKIDHAKYGNLRSKVAYLSEKFEREGEQEWRRGGMHGKHFNEA
jgi:hypothetical protein